ncbi:interferon gamma [Festucalex cinctus]
MVAMARAMLGVCVYLCVCRVGTSLVPVRMNRTIQNLLQLYKIPPKELFNSRPVFSRELLGTKMEAKALLMSAVLRTYEELLGRMLKRLPGPTAPAPVDDSCERDPGSNLDTKAQLYYLLKCVRDLRKRRYQEQDQLLDWLQKLRGLQMDNLVIQSKALWELPGLYEEASSLAESVRPAMTRRRRRRQTLRHRHRRRQPQNHV